MKTAYLVDGYNVIYSSPFLKKLLEKDIFLAQEELVRQVLGYCCQEEVEGWIVFDAYRRPLGNVVEKLTNLIRVVFTGAGQTADSYIESFVSRNKSRYDYIYVVTFDYPEMMTVVDKHILLYSPRSFLKEIASGRETRRREDFSFRTYSGPRLFDYLGKEVIDQLRRLAKR